MHTQFSEKLPILKKLIILDYIEEGEEKKIRIIKEASHKWKDIVSLLAEDPNRVSTLELEHQGKPHDCLRQAFIEDFINNKPADYSQDWRGLIKLLDDVDLEVLAKRVKYALLHST